jgi:hypothetical protein
MNESYCALVLREFQRLKKLADDAIGQLEQTQFFTAPAAGDNSIATIVKHVSGNLLSRWTDFLTSDGEKPGRDRDTEFTILAGETHARLLVRWEQGWSALFTALEPLTTADLERTVTIRREPLTVLQAINRQLTHYAYHVGQIVYVAKHLRGPAWRSLSIPPGASQSFNQAPSKYISASQQGVPEETSVNPLARQRR